MFAYMWIVKQKSNKQIKQNKVIDTDTDWWLPDGSGMGGGRKG